MMKKYIVLFVLISVGNLSIWFAKFKVRPNIEEPQQEMQRTTVLNKNAQRETTIDVVPNNLQHIKDRNNLFAQRMISRVDIIIRVVSKTSYDISTLQNIKTQIQILQLDINNVDNKKLDRQQIRSYLWEKRKEQKTVLLSLKEELQNILETFRPKK